MSIPADATLAQTVAALHLAALMMVPDGLTRDRARDRARVLLDEALTAVEAELGDWSRALTLIVEGHRAEIEAARAGEDW